jgi:hypothetical protein
MEAMIKIFRKAANNLFEKYRAASESEIDDTGSYIVVDGILNEMELMEWLNGDKYAE